MTVTGQLVTRSGGRARWVLAVSLASSLAFAVLAGEMHMVVASLGLGASLLAVILSAQAIAWGKSAPKTASIAAFGDEVVIDDVRTPKRDVVSAHRERDRLVVELANGKVHELVASAGEIDAFIETLGLPHSRVTRIVVGGLTTPATQTAATVGAVLLSLLAAPLVAGLLLAIIGALLRHREDEFTAMTVLVIPAFVATMLALRSWRTVRRTSVYIGGEGVRVERRSYPFSRLQARKVPGAVILVAGVENVRIACASEHEATQLLKTIEDARAGRPPPTDIDTASLARGGDDAEAWKTRLLSILAADAYRATLGADELARVVEDTSASAESRVAAAVALSSLHAEAPERARVRVAVEGVADPKLRVALERAEEGELTDESIDVIAKDES